MLKIANILVVSAKSNLLMQHNNDNPDINDAGKIDLFGGPIKAGETPIGGAVRELKEETGLEIHPSDLEFFDTYYKEASVHGQDAEVHVFILAGVNEDRVYVYGGQSLWVVRRGDDLNAINFSVLAREVVDGYLKRKKKR